MTHDPDRPCPCESGKRLGECCLRVIEGERAETAEELMRTRYTAYVLQDTRYLLHSWHPDTRPASIDIVTDQRWLGLRIKRTENGKPSDTNGTVEFVARFKVGGRGHRLHEVSRFEKTADGWKYIDGELKDNERGASRSSRKR